MGIRAKIALVCLPLLSLPGALSAQDDAAMMAAEYAQPPAGWTIPRTAWGDPDLSGKWPIDYLSATPRERPASSGTQAFLDDAEYQVRRANPPRRRWVATMRRTRPI